MANSNDTAYGSSTGGGGGGGGGGTVKAVDGNSPDPTTGNAVSGGPKTGAQVSALLAGASTADRAGLIAALKNDGLLNGLLKDS